MSCLNPTSPHSAREGGLLAETYFVQALQRAALASVLALHNQRVRNTPPKYCRTHGSSLDDPRHLFAEG